MEREYVSEQMQSSGEFLQQPLYLALLTFSFSIKTLMTYIYALKTKNEYKFRSEDLFDMCIGITVSGWVGIFLFYQNLESTYELIAKTRI